MGFLARTVPEMNIFILGFSLRIGIGLIVVWLTLPIFCWLFLDMHEQFFKFVSDFIRLGGPAGG